MAIQYLTYNDDNMEPGKFYVIEANKDLASNIREVTSLTEPLNQISIIQQKQLDDKVIILDNQARINNIEDKSLKDNFIAGMELASIRKEFVNSNYIEISYGRNEINKIQVWGEVENSSTEKIYQEITSGIEIKIHEKYNNGEVFEKLVVVETTQPITGYVLIL